MHDFVEFVAHTTRRKIVICNSMNRKLKSLFRADTLIEIPSRNWSFEYGTWKRSLERHVAPEAIILIAGGMCSKVLIARSRMTMT